MPCALKYRWPGSVSLCQKHSGLFAAMAQPAVAMQAFRSFHRVAFRFAEAFRSFRRVAFRFARSIQVFFALSDYITHVDQREEDLIRRVTHLENTCRDLERQITFLSSGPHGLARANLPQTPGPNVNRIVKGPPSTKRPPPPLPDNYHNPEEVGPQPSNMVAHEEYQREHRRKAAPPSAVVASLTMLHVGVPKLPSGHGHETYITTALQVPQVPPQPLQQNSPIRPPAQVSPVTSAGFSPIGAPANSSS